MKAGYAVAIAALLGGLWSQPASAQDPVLTCSGSDICEVNPGTITYDAIDWSFNPGSTDLTVPSYCGDSTTCGFYCPNSPGRVTVTVTLSRGGQTVATVSSAANCTAEPL